MENEPNTNNLNVINLKIHELNNNVKNKDIKPATYDQSSESTHDPQSGDDVINYIVPKFSDDLINDLTDINNIIYNKNYKLETYKNKALFYIQLTHQGREVKLYAYGYKPNGYKNIDNLGLIYFVSTEWFLISGFAPFTQDQFYKLMSLMYNFKNS